eukprot:scaffold85060_cov23-Tisochrysis_lutea.AAC.1
MGPDLELPQPFSDKAGGRGAKRICSGQQSSAALLAILENFTNFVYMQALACKVGVPVWRQVLHHSSHCKVSRPVRQQALHHAMQNASASDNKALL